MSSLTQIASSLLNLMKITFNNFILTKYDYRKQNSESACIRPHSNASNNDIDKSTVGVSNNVISEVSLWNDSISPISIWTPAKIELAIHLFTPRFVYVLIARSVYSADIITFHCGHTPLSVRAGQHPAITDLRHTLADIFRKIDPRHFGREAFGVLRVTKPKPRTRPSVPHFELCAPSGSILGCTRECGAKNKAFNYTHACFVSTEIAELYAFVCGF